MNGGQTGCALVVMGVSGSGKTTVGVLLAKRLGWPFAEGDRLHVLDGIGNRLVTAERTG